MNTHAQARETHVQKFDHEIGLDQESAASWRKRWEAELADARDNARLEAIAEREDQIEEYNQ